MREIRTRKALETFKLNDKIFTVDLTPKTLVAFRAKWALLLPKVEEATEKAAEEGRKLDELAENKEGFPVEELEAKVKKQAEIYEKSVMVLLELCKEIINSRLVGEPFDEILDECQGDFESLMEVLIVISEITKENRKP